MWLMLSPELWVLFCLFIGLIFALITLSKGDNVIYLRMVCWAVICAFFARFFHVVVLLLYGEYDMNINMGTMGVFGSLLFLLSANFGQIDGLVDDGSKRAIKARVIALIAPLVIVIPYAYFFLLNVSLMPLDFFINTTIVVIIVLPCVYFSFKHLIIYDVQDGLVKSLRMYNLLAVIYELSIAAEWISFRMAFFDEFNVIMALQGLAIMLIVPVTGRGIKKWKAI